MRNLVLKNLFLPGMLVVLSVLCFDSSASADPAPLPNNRHIFINVANDAGVKYDLDGAAYGGPSNTYYIKSDGGGLNSNWIAPLAADTTKVATTVTSAGPATSGTLYLNDAGGRGFSDDIILLVSVKGPIADNFSVNIKSSGYTWTPAAAGVYNPPKPAVITYQPAAVDETFTKADVIYGPHTAKPGPGTLGVWSLPLYPGQMVSDLSTAEYLMFIDLKAGAMRDDTLTDNGAVKVDYSFNNLYGDASFNMYAWVTASNQGEGISFTNPSTTNGYTVSYTGPPVAGVTYSTPGPYKAGSNVTITAEFSRDLADSPVPMISLTGADSMTYSMTKVDARHYSYSYTAGTGNGVVNVSLTGKDLVSSSQLTYDPISGATFTLDNTPPTAAITYSPAGPYKAGDIVTVSATFSEAMADSPVPRIALSGADTLTAVEMIKTDVTHYSYSYTAGSGDGDVTVALSTGTDSVGNQVVSVPTSGATFVLKNAKTMATVNLGNFNFTYDGTTKAATATTTPAGLNVTFTYDGSATAPTAAGSYLVTATIDDTNYQGSATGTLTIAKAAATVNLGNLTFTYDGTAKSATATTTPAGLNVTFTYDGSATAPTAAGSYLVTATVNETNYQGSATGTLFIFDPNARIYGSPILYGLLQLAYNDAVTGAVIQAKGITFIENLTIGASKAVTLMGGFDSNFSTQNGYTILQGTLTVGQGSLVVDHLVIK